MAKRKKFGGIKAFFKRIPLLFRKEKVKTASPVKPGEAHGEPVLPAAGEPTRVVDIPVQGAKKNADGREAEIVKQTAKVTFGAFGMVLRKVITYALNILLTVLLVALITGAATVLAFVVYIKNYVDPEYNGLDNLRFDSSLSTFIYYVDDNGNEVEMEDDRLYGSENRLWVEYNDIPKNLINACIAVEDQRFMTHNGVDAKRTFSAIFNYFIPTSSNYGGGSTITQQLIKNVSGENETTIQRKVQEMFRAFNVESKFSKTEILEMYLNTIYLSHNCNGVRAAAETYFGKDVSELTLTECAAIASIGKSPIAYDPIINPKNNLQRRNLVLKLMLEQGKISEEEFNESYDSPLMLNTGSGDDESASSANVHSYYIDAMLDNVIEALMETYDCDATTASRMLYSGGLQIVSCVDPVIQSIVEEVYTDDTYWSKVTGVRGQSAMCVIDNDTGELLAIVGGRGEKKVARGLNRATMSKRQCGSSVKPLSVYSLAIEKGLLYYGSAVDDVPQIYTESADTYWPYNATKVFAGTVSLSYALQTSLNTVAVNTCLKLGVDVVYDNMVNNLGFTTLVDNLTYDDGSSYSDKQVSPLALGSFTYGVTTREMTQAYSVLANGGIFTEAHTFSEIRDSRGNVIVDNTPEQRIVYKESTAYIMTSLLMKVITGSYGTARNDVKLHKEYPGLEVCGKTGSTNDNKDNYFCGYTPDYTACAWFGYDNNKTITASGNPATQAWNYVMEKIYKWHVDNSVPYTEKFTVPAGVSTGVSYCAISGMYPCEACQADLGVANGSMRVIYNDGVYVNDEHKPDPSNPCDKHILVNYDSDTKAVCLEGCTCPQETLTQVSLRRVDRLLYKNLRITDAQFLWYDVPEGYEPPESEYVPYWRYLMPEGTYMGFSSGSEMPANRVCVIHWTGTSGDDTSSEVSSDTSQDDVSQNGSDVSQPETSAVQ